SCATLLYSSCYPHSPPLLYFSSPLSFLSNATAPSEIYTLSLHDALPISFVGRCAAPCGQYPLCGATLQKELRPGGPAGHRHRKRSEEHTSELQSRFDLVCRLLLEKKKKTNKRDTLEHIT